MKEISSCQTSCQKLIIIISLLSFIVKPDLYSEIIKSDDYHYPQNSIHEIIDLGVFLRDKHELALPYGIATSSQLLQNLRSLLSQTLYEYTESFTYDITNNSVSYNQTCSASCNGNGPVLKIKYDSVINQTGTQRRDYLEAYGCDNYFLFKEIVISHGEGLKKVSAKNLIYGRLSDWGSLFLPEKGLVKRVYKLFFSPMNDLPIFEIEQTYRSDKNLMKFKMVDYLLYEVEEKFFPGERSIRFKLHKNYFKLPDFIFKNGKLKFSMGLLSVGHTHVADIIVKDVGSVLPREEYFMDMVKTTKTTLVGFINGAIYTSVNRFKQRFIDNIIVRHLLPSIPKTTMTQETRFLRELKEIKIFLNQNTPDALEKAKNRINEYILGVEDNSIVVTDKRP